MTERGPLVRWKTVTGDQVGLLRDVPVEGLRQAEPWRRVRSYHGRPHYAGWYWAATTCGFVTYESRLELARLLLADHDPTVVWIVSQPFLVDGDDGGARHRRHIPDFLLLRLDQTVTVVNVKPADRLRDERVAAALSWAGEVFAARGWRHEIWSATSPVRLANVRFLSAYRRADRCDRDALASLLHHAPRAETVGQLEDLCTCDRPRPLIRPALLHHLWTGALAFDLDAPLSRNSPLTAAPVASPVV